MDLEELLLAWLVIPAAWAFLLWSGFKLRLARHYPLIYACFGAEIVLSLANRSVSYWFGRSSYAYSYFFYGSGLVTLALEAAVLVSVYRVFGRFRLAKDWHLAAIPAGLILFGLIRFTEIWLYVRVYNLALVACCYLAMAACVRMALRRDIDLGWNLKGTLLSLSLPMSLQGMILISYNSGLPIAYAAVNAWGLRIGTVCWLIVAAAMSEYSPPCERRDWRLSPHPLLVPESGSAVEAESLAVNSPGRPLQK